MSQLSNNTTALQAILEAVNALPEAGGGELKSASGTATRSSGKVLTITGLNFTPSIVYIHNRYCTVFTVRNGDGIVFETYNGQYGAGATLSASGSTCTVTTSGTYDTFMRNETYNFLAYGV